MLSRPSGLLVACLLFFASGLIWATEKHASDINMSGYVDVSYNYLVKNHQFISGVNDRVNDLTQNGFTLQQAALTLAKQPPQGLGGLLNLFVGRDAYSIAPYGWNPYFGSQTLGLVIPKAYLQYAIGQYTFIGGIFETRVGLENFDSNKDPNFSRSILDGYAEPGVLMGIRGTYAASDHLGLNAGLNNGWSGIRDTSRQVTMELGAAYVFNSLFSLTLQGLSGEQRLRKKIATGPMSRRNIINAIASFKATNALTLSADCDYAIQNKAISSNGSIGRAVWQGISGYVNYQLNEKWRTSLRGEIYDDQNGFTTGVRQNWRELTLTLAYVSIKNAELRAETRHDFSNVNSFTNVSGAGVSRNQQSYAMEALYNF